MSDISRTLSRPNAGRIFFEQAGRQKENLMTVTLELPSEVEAQITQEAADNGLPLPDYLLSAIRQRNAPVSEGLATYLLSESALAKDWLRPEEDEAWQHL